MAPVSCLPACPEFGIMELDADFVSQFIQQAELSNTDYKLENQNTAENSYNAGDLGQLCGELGNLELELEFFTAAAAPAHYGLYNGMNQLSISTPNLATYSPSFDLGCYSPPNDYTCNMYTSKLPNTFSSPLSGQAVASDPFQSPVQYQSPPQTMNYHLAVDTYTVKHDSHPTGTHVARTTHQSNPRARAKSVPVMPALPPMPVQTAAPAGSFSQSTPQINLYGSRQCSSDQGNTFSAISPIPSSPEHAQSPCSLTENKRGPQVAMDDHTSKRRSSTPSTHSSPSSDSLPSCRKGSHTGPQRRLRRRRAQLTLPFGCFLCAKSYQELRSLQHHCRMDHEVKITKAMYELFESRANAAE